jgi:ABC-2 type transport system permease protein
MIGEIGTVAWKEWRNQLAVRGRGGIVLFVVLFGFALPLIQRQFFLIFAVLLPLLLTISAATDSFAGERERHTLETLLATPLTDGAILGGKLAGLVTWNWGVPMLTTPVGLAVVAIVYGLDGIPLSPAVAVLAAVGALALALLTAAVGVIASMRAATVREAELRLTALVLGPLLALPALAAVAPAGWRDDALDVLAGAGAEKIAAVAVTVLLVLDAVAIAVAARRFRRARLLAG